MPTDGVLQGIVQALLRRTQFSDARQKGPRRDAIKLQFLSRLRRLSDGRQTQGPRGG